MNYKENTQVLLPGGEWLDAIVSALELLNLPIRSEASRSYRFTFVEQGLMDIVFTVVRSRDIFKCLNDASTRVAVGMTGSDIVEELQEASACSGTFPLVARLMEPRPSLVVGATPNVGSISPSLADLNRSVIYTTYPSTARKFLRERGIRATIKKRDGKIEGMWRIDPKNKGIVDIMRTRATANANGIIPLEDISQPEVVFVQNDVKLSPQDRRQSEYFQELIWIRSRGWL